MKINILTSVLFCFLILSYGCKEEEEVDPWFFCEDCPIETWVGEYTGTGDSFDSDDNELIENLPTTISIENTSNNLLYVSVICEDYYSGSFTKIKEDDSYEFDVAGSSQSLSLSLSQKSDAYKVVGNVKIYHYEKPDSLVIDYNLAFETTREK